MNRRLLPLAVIAAAACAGNAARRDTVTEVPKADAPSAAATPAAPADAGVQDASAASSADDACGFARVHFGFDSATLDGEAREALVAAAKCIGDKKLVAVTVEGHCDDRGTEAYNLALGQRRADAVRSYLENLGIHTQIRVVSFGKAYPVAAGETESAWKENRRAEFRTPGQKLSDGQSAAPQG
ncbi:MAG TPA: OmpA family protein [Anaeromyxobacteraceae bacterium]|nr:OmpA family protein [Anaeromyxobacteraceae bacterium]